ncbi:hypothetical protein BG452_17460 [Streptomyces sp. CBMA123]|nr:hypothetical protein [Streptomyces sp. CBMA123]
MGRTGVGQPGVLDERSALTGAGLTAARAALWVRDLARRQARAGHRAVLEDFAGAVAAAGADLDPADRELGGVSEEVRHRLTAYVLLGPAGVNKGPDLSRVEAVALAALAAVATAFPTAVVQGVGALPQLCRLMNATVDAARAADALG